MIWVDREVNKIKERKLPLEWVDDMKTPSGRIHVGALRGVVIYDLVYKVLIENKVNANYTYVFENHDPMDAIPSYFEQSKWEKYAGMQLYEVPSPEPGFKNYAEFYAKEFQEVFESINCHPKIIWALDLYTSGKMNSAIKKVLDGAAKIREIYYKVTKNVRPNDWFPFNAKCEKCQKIGTTQVYKWDGRFVYYRCLPNLVEWATGCGHQGKVSPFNGTGGKIPWKVEWAAKWQAIGVTIEGAGKDHMSKGGSYDIASAICKEVLDYPPPYPVAYEWFTVGGRKMSSSKGIGSSAKEVSEILPPDVFRFLIVRAPIERAIDFHPEGDTIPNLFDDYDRCLNAYFDKIEKKISDGKQGEVTLEFARITELSQVKPLPKKRLFLPRFRTIVNLTKTNKQNLIGFFEEIKKSPLTPEEKEILAERIVYAKKMLAGSQPAKTDFKLNENQKKFLRQLADRLEKLKNPYREQIQQIVFDVLKQGNFKAKEAFQGFYQVLTGQDSGPKAADLILNFGIEKIVKKTSRLN